MTIANVCSSQAQYQKSRRYIECILEDQILLKDSNLKPRDVELSFAKTDKDHQSHDRAEQLYLFAVKSRKEKAKEGHIETLIDVAELAYQERHDGAQELWMLVFTQRTELDMLLLQKTLY
ncbi:hypothetical protein N7G274_003832 [Stereocaulon virgatum]|uniref:Uncharacterized protein n=1 Tax=Stereocaulon virgatum TaxID=373712 RepID=A0ABR4ADF3_9LECA